MKNNKVIIELKYWDHECSDHCCFDFGTSITVNGVECDNPYSGDDVQSSLKFVLEQLGMEFEIIGQ